MRFRADVYDQAVSALIEDIYERGLDKRVLVCVTGEFGTDAEDQLRRQHRRRERRALRLERSSRAAITGRGRSRTSGRAAGSRPAAFIGATDKRGEDSIERIWRSGRLPGDDLPAYGDRLDEDVDQGLQWSSDADRGSWPSDPRADGLSSGFDARLRRSPPGPGAPWWGMRGGHSLPAGGRPSDTV